MVHALLDTWCLRLRICSDWLLMSRHSGAWGQDLFEISTRPQYIEECRPVFKRIFYNQCIDLLSHFYVSLKSAVEDAMKFSEGCEYIMEDYEYVDPMAMAQILYIFGRFWQRKVPSTLPIRPIPLEYQTHVLLVVVYNCTRAWLCAG